MKVKLFSNYDTSENLLSRFLSNYTLVDDALTFTIAEDYNFAVVFNKTDETLNNQSKIITIIQEPSWSPAIENNSFLLNSDYVIVHDAALFERKIGKKLGGKVIESPSYMFYHDRVDKTFFYYAASTKKIKKLSMIISYLNKPLGIYQKRIGLLKKILDSDLDIDIYGWKLNIDDPRVKGFIPDKFTGLLPYEYSIAIENCQEKNYITEKFVDCVLCNTVPIYAGAPNIKQVYDDRYFRTLDLDSSFVVQDIQGFISETPSYSTQNKTIYFNEMNLYTKLKHIIFSDSDLSFKFFP